MTVRDRLHQYLTGNGLWENEADKVLDIIKSDDNYKALSDVFSDYSHR